MQSNRLTTLAINPGTRYMGIAVLRGSDLLDWGVKVSEGKWSPDKLAKAAAIVSQLISEYKPNIIVIKRPHPSRTSNQLDGICQLIEDLAAVNHLQLRCYSIKEVEAFHQPCGRMNKWNLAEIICPKYPALQRALRIEQQAINSYHMRMFEAVALGLMPQGKSGE